MSLRQPFTMTPARREANRRNARQSTGPRTARGEGQSRMNGLRGGGRSRFYRSLMLTLFDALRCGVGRTAPAVLTPNWPRTPCSLNSWRCFAKLKSRWLGRAGSCASGGSLEKEFFFCTT